MHPILTGVSAVTCAPSYSGYCSSARLFILCDRVWFTHLGCGERQSSVCGRYSDVSPRGCPIHPAVASTVQNDESVATRRLCEPFRQGRHGLLPRVRSHPILSIPTGTKSCTHA